VEVAALDVKFATFVAVRDRLYETPFVSPDVIEIGEALAVLMMGEDKSPPDTVKV
jgi:hypothetical protein